MAGLNRRAFTKLATMAAGAAVFVVVLPGKKYGRVNVHDHPRLARRCHASVDGIEVTSRCYEANDIEGYALCFVEESPGRTARNNDLSPKEERLNGNVRIWEV